MPNCSHNQRLLVAVAASQNDLVSPPADVQLTRVNELVVKSNVRERRAIAFIDGQNFLRTTSNLYSLPDRWWNYDPRKLVDVALERIHRRIDTPMKYSEIRVYTGVPRADKDPIGRQHWQRLFQRFQADGINSISYDLHYRHGSVYASHEKRVDVRIALDLADAVREDRTDSVVLFSQDSDLDVAIVRAKEYLTKEKERTGQERLVDFFCAYPQSIYPEQNHPIRGMIGIELSKQDIQSALYPRSPTIDADTEILRLEDRFKRPATRGYNFAKEGPECLKGTLVGAFQTPDRTGVLVLYTPTELIELLVHPYCSELAKDHEMRRVTIRPVNTSPNVFGRPFIHVQRDQWKPQKPSGALRGTHHVQRHM
ncbi:MAG TPA: NYN domain-containing protein [Candidatus Baltobacteraceae bacterium]|jgi:uncharacterized LabA/DUF88 family protein|nr:NYN domain-containing protein [Candidatus Baltobacteraceae bacterium]